MQKNEQSYQIPVRFGEQSQPSREEENGQQHQQHWHAQKMLHLRSMAGLRVSGLIL